MRDVNGVSVKPLSPFSKDSQTIIHQEFIDYQTGERKQGSHYFKSLIQTILGYANQPEYKFGGDVGQLERKCIVGEDVVHPNFPASLGASF